MIGDYVKKGYLVLARQLIVAAWNGDFALVLQPNNRDYRAKRYHIGGTLVPIVGTPVRNQDLRNIIKVCVSIETYQNIIYTQHIREHTNYEKNA